MKKISWTLFLLSVIMVSISCKKSNDAESSNNYYFKAKFDGSSKEFNTTVVATKSSLGAGIYSLVITGMTGTEQSALSLWSDKDDFTAGKTFTINALNGTTYNLLAFVTPLGSSTPTSQWTSTYSYGAVPQSLQCTITEATTTYIKGTFSSVIYQNNDVVVAKKIITEGQFYAKF